MKPTKWFPKGTKPARPGIYQINVFYNEHRYSEWNGEAWSWFADTINDLFDFGYRTQRHTKLFAWRGLANKPK